MNREWLSEIHQKMLSEQPPAGIEEEALVQRILEGWNPSKIDPTNASIFRRKVGTGDYSETTREWAMDLQMPAAF